MREEYFVSGSWISRGSALGIHLLEDSPKEYSNLDSPKINLRKGELILPGFPKPAPSSSLPARKPQRTEISLTFKEEIWPLDKSKEELNRHNDQIHPEGLLRGKRWLQRFQLAEAAGDRARLPVAGQ